MRDGDASRADFTFVIVASDDDVVVAVFCNLDDFRLTKIIKINNHDEIQVAAVFGYMFPNPYIIDLNDLILIIPWNHNFD